MIGPAAENARYRLLRLGRACNADCLFCNVPPERGGREPRTEDLEREIGLLAAAGERRLELSGGEPTLRRDLARLVARARAAGFTRVQLQTNGLELAGPGRAAELRRAGLTHAFVSLHSQVAVAHDGLARRRGAWEACVRAVDLLLAEGVEVILNPVVTEVQRRSLAGYMRFVRARLPGVRAVSLSVVQPHGRAWDRARLVPLYGALSPFVEEALIEAEDLGLPVVNPYCGLPLCVGGWHRRLERCVEWCESEGGRAPADAMKVRPEACGGCALRGRCGGVWRRYLALDPAPALRPLAAAPGGAA